jgi:FKBP-type peptidyl-prolyl cis-trans isomerase FkpA
MFQKTILSILIIVCSLTAYGQKKFKSTPTGLKYIMYTANKGDKPKIGDVIKFHFILKDNKDSTLASSYSSGVPPVTRVQPPVYKGDLFEGLAMMSKGDSALFEVSADSFYNGQRMPVKSGTMLTIMIKMLEITPAAVFEEQMKKQQEETAKKGSENKAKEAGLIADYIKAKAPNAKKTASGLYYVIESEGTGVIPQPGQTITAHYTGMFLDGKEFDSDHGAGFSFVVGQHQVITGWDEGFLLLKKGSKAKLIIPSSLGYGSQGAGAAIPPYSPLVFEVELVDVK